LVLVGLIMDICCGIITWSSDRDLGSEFFHGVTEKDLLKKILINLHGFPELEELDLPYPLPNDSLDFMTDSITSEALIKAIQEYVKLLANLKGRDGVALKIDTFLLTIEGDSPNYKYKFSIG
jgi:hypothetical protein